MSTADSDRQPYLSVVVATRNDDHGGDPLKRLQAFVNCFDEQCRRTGLDAELIVVEWNPPEDRPRIDTLLRLPDPPFCAYRFIEVPADIHQRLRYADVLPLFQMIAKNVGIRRARGRFVLATNIDIIFATELVGFVASRQLQPGWLYRVDRHDIQPDFPVDATLEVQMNFCASHHLRVHTRWGSDPVDSVGRPICYPEDIGDGTSVRLGRGWHVREGVEGARYRWGSDRAELLLDPEAAGLTDDAVVELEIESNPYDDRSWVELLAVEDDHPLLDIRVEGRMRVDVPLRKRDSSRQRRIELRVTGESPESRGRLPAFERRDALHYRVSSARVRPISNGQMFEYPPAGWAVANASSSLTVVPTADGLHVTTDPQVLTYCVKYGPLRAPKAGIYRFEVIHTLSEGGLELGALAGDQSVWLPSSVRVHHGSPSRRLEIAIDLQRGDQFWLVISNNHPDRVGVSRFVVQRLDGSVDAAETIVAPVRVETRRERLIRALRTYRPRWHESIRALTDRIAGTIVSMAGDRLRARIVRASPEFQSIEQALRASDTQLREIAPLRPLADFDVFLRERRPDNLHVNACGDFQLMAREHWYELRAYPEFETFSMNIDGLFSYIADAAGIKEQVLDAPIYHLEHEVGSGWSPEGEAALRRRISERGITWLDATAVYIWAAYMRWLGRPMIVNTAAWGLADDTLTERTLGDRLAQPQLNPPDLFDGRGSGRLREQERQ